MPCGACCRAAAPGRARPPPSGWRGERLCGGRVSTAGGWSEGSEGRDEERDENQMISDMRHGWSMRHGGARERVSMMPRALQGEGCSSAPG